MLIAYRALPGTSERLTPVLARLSMPGCGRLRLMANRLNGLQSRKLHPRFRLEFGRDMRGKTLCL